MKMLIWGRLMHTDRLAHLERIDKTPVPDLTSIDFHDGDEGGNLMSK